MIKVKFRNLPSQLSLLLLAFLLTFSITTYAQEGPTAAADQPAATGVGDAAAGKTLFNANCAACHKLYKKATGPALYGVGDKYDREWLYKWINNSQELVKAGDPQAVAIFEEFNQSVMTAFPALSTTDIDNIIAYTYTEQAVPTAGTDTAGGGGATGTGDGPTSTIILGVLALVFLLLVVMLFLVTKTLRKIAEANGVVYDQREPRLPIWKAFVQNQFLVFVTAVVLLLGSAYFAYGWMMQVGMDQGYAPVQPIHYSHKIHAGANQIDCNYCHSSARKSKHSGIPSLNVCMNCHKNIAEYNGEEDLENGYTKEFYTAEIKKLYEAVGWDEANQAYTGNSKPVKWVRIHNLPDFAYFNHSQHVTVAGIECQKCHGPVEEMEIMYQFSPLTMGWCINCHRETNVDLKGNEYYQKIHEELSKKYGVDQLTIAQMGGLECGKCHY
jgi:mono/diheme cytochrome c family protein